MRDWWTPEELRNAARLLQDAAGNLHTSFPYSPSRPNPTTLDAVMGMIAGAMRCIQAAQPEQADINDFIRQITPANRHAEQ